YRVMTTQIMATKLNGDDRLAMVETLSLTLLALLALWLVRRIEAGSDVRGGSKGTPPPPRPIEGRLRRTGLALLTWGIALWLILPHLALLLVSLVPRGTWSSEALPPV